MFHFVVMCLLIYTIRNPIQLYFIIYSVLVYKLALPKENFKKVKPEKQKDVD